MLSVGPLAYPGPNLNGPPLTCLTKRVVYVSHLLTQVAVVTGGNSGIGLETVRALLRKGAKVYIAARNEAKARNALTKLREDPGTNAGAADFLYLDLASFRSIEQFVRAFREREARLDLLFNNAGLFFPKDKGEKTAEGYEIHMGVNALGVHYLTELLMPLLLESAKRNAGRPPRVCFTSSLGHLAAPKHGFDSEDPSGANVRFRLLSAEIQAYSNSKVRRSYLRDGQYFEYVQDAYAGARKFQRVHGKDGVILYVQRTHPVMHATRAISSRASRATSRGHRPSCSTILSSRVSCMRPSWAPYRSSMRTRRPRPPSKVVCTTYLGLVGAALHREPTALKPKMQVRFPSNPAAAYFDAQIAKHARPL